MMPVCAAKCEPQSIDVTPWVPRITDRCGLYFGPTRVRRLQEALARRMTATKLASGDYEQRLASCPNDPEWQILIDELVINETWFFRHKPSFKLLETTILPERFQIAANLGEGPVRILSAGCANGAEAYSLAICALETDLRGGTPFEILGLDISRSAIGLARNGEFSQRCLRDLSPGLLQRYFQPSARDTHYQAEPNLMRHTQFQVANLMAAKDPLPGNFDVIFCQNLMIYANHTHRNHLLSQFANHLKPSGYLLLGPAEILRLREPGLVKKSWEQTLVFQRAAQDTRR